MQRRRFVQLGLVTLVAVATGFTVTGLSRLVVSRELALVLGAPLVLVGSLCAVVTFVLAVLVRAGFVALDEADRETERA